jgi:hypothetical protein
MYEEKWKDIAQTHNTIKLEDKLKADERIIVRKYGKEGFKTIGNIVTSQTERPKDLIKKLARSLYKRDKNVILQMCYLHPNLKQYETLLNIWWSKLIIRNTNTTAKETLEEFLIEKSIITEIYTLKVLAGSVNVTLMSKVGYDEFLWIFSKAIFFAACENACSFLTQENTQSNSIPLALRIGRYQRAMCVDNLNKYREDNDYQQVSMNKPHKEYSLS